MGWGWTAASRVRRTQRVRTVRLRLPDDCAWVACVRRRVHSECVCSGCVPRTPGTPLRECPPLRSSFISLRGVPGALCTVDALFVRADQPPLCPTLTLAVCSAQRNKGGAKRGTFAEQSTPSA